MLFCAVGISAYAFQTLERKQYGVYKEDYSFLCYISGSSRRVFPSRSLQPMLL